MTVLVSLATKAKAEEDLKGLVYSLTEKTPDTARRWYQNPMWLGAAVLAFTLALNIIFF